MFIYNVTALHGVAEGTDFRTVQLSPESSGAANDGTTYKNFDLGRVKFSVLKPDNAAKKKKEAEARKAR